MAKHPFFSLFLFAIFVLECKSGLGYELALPGCDQKCGNLTVPYPFGTSPECYLNDDFLISCTPPTPDDPNTRAFLTHSTINVTNIDLLSGELQAWTYIAHQCFNEDNTLNNETSNRNPWLRLAMYTASYTKNKLTVVGCDAYSYFEGPDFKTGCMSFCKSQVVDDNSGCTGNGCCQVAIPKKAKGIFITLRSLNNVSSRYPCSYAFVVEEAYYKFSSLDYTSSRLSSVVEFPLILDWTIGTQTCVDARKNMTAYACKANSDCYDSNNGPGYRCNCTRGYEGNPYLPTGCQDIDECSTLNHPCNVTCFNLPGGYRCSPCPKGYKGDGKNDGDGCVPLPPSPSDRKALITGLGISLSISALLLAGAWLYWGLQKRKLIQLRKKHFKENGGTTLQELLSRHDSQIVAFKIFTAQELNKATHNYDESRVLGKGGQGTVYKGELPDNTIVAIKRSNAIDKSQVQQFINEIVVLSRIDHKNVVKILGCCLETEIPMLVYEFIAHGTLYDHIQRDHTPRIAWRTRLSIAAETAGAISYLHSAASIPIIHRDIKTTNILLDESYNAKVSDFGTSKFAPVDKASMTTLVQGTLGYLDPEYFFSSQLTEKSDVYSFGVVLLELLTGAQALNFERKEEERSLSMYFMLCLKEERLLEIIDDSVKRQANGKQLMDVAMIAAKCLNLRGEDRPSMKEVATELEKLAKMEMMHPWIQDDITIEEESELLIRGSIPSEGNSLQIDGHAIAIGR